jgi:integrase/recombinase XerD
MLNVIKGFKQYNTNLKKSQNTIDNYMIELNAFLKDFNINSIEDLEQLQEKEFINNWLIEMNNKGYASKTINKKKNVLSIFSSYLILENIIEENKFKQLSNINDNNNKIDIYTNEEIEKIYSYMEEKIKEDKFQRKIDKDVYKTNLVAIKLMAACALRVNELSKIRLSDIDLESGKILIRGKGHKGEVSRFNKVNKEVLKSINEYLEIRSKINIKEEAQEYLFISPISKNNITNESIRNFIKKINKELGITTSSPCHAFRHNKATELIAKGADVKKVSLYLGHTSQNTTEKYYIHQDIDTIEELSEL